ncbi:MAG: hypothetical protein RSD40_06350, partial [Bacilli bacterium]
MLIKKIVFGIMCGILLPNQNVFSEPVKFLPSTQYFSVRDFYVPNQSGYNIYSVDGFYEGVSSEANPKLLLFPKLQLNTNSIAILDSMGKKVDNTENFNKNDVSRIIISVN